MISLIHKKKSEETDSDKHGYKLIVIEELLFWSGLGALAFGTGWVMIAGGIALSAAIVLTIYLFAYT